MRPRDAHADRIRAGVRLFAFLLAAALAAAAAIVAADAGAETPAASAARGETAAAAPAMKPAGAAASVAADSASAPRRVIAYYFHTTKRCVSCRKLEALAKHAIESGFAREMASGALVFLPVNVEEKGNEHFIEDYRLFTKHVVLVDERGGKQQAWKNLPKIWEYLNDKAKFERYVQDETRAFLAAARS